jgi:UDP-N-acetyl-D-glucosamine/UDP-N-acetyl-D-galactosamine dehydrogenase
MLVAAGRPVDGARVGILGLTFKEDVPDLRNSRVPDIVAELKTFGIEPMVHDPIADAAEAERECGIMLVPKDRLSALDGLIYAVPHQALKRLRESRLVEMLNDRGVIFDVKSALDYQALPPQIMYASL